jgi:hypothetical protein
MPKKVVKKNKKTPKKPKQSVKIKNKNIISINIDNSKKTTRKQSNKKQNEPIIVYNNHPYIEIPKFITTSDIPRVIEPVNIKVPEEVKGMNPIITRTHEEEIPINNEANKKRKVDDGDKFYNEITKRFNKDTKQNRKKYMRMKTKTLNEIDESEL